MCIDDRCVLCDSGVVEDLVHFLSVCEEFREDRRLLLVAIENIAGAGAWVKEMEIGSNEERMLLLMGRKAEGVDEEVLGKINGSRSRPSKNSSSSNSSITMSSLVLSFLLT